MSLDENATDKSIRDDVLSFIMAGRDSTSSVLAWFIYCLVSKPEVAEKIYDELCAFEARHQPTPTLNSGKYAYITIDDVHEFVTVFTAFRIQIFSLVAQLCIYKGASVLKRMSCFSDRPSSTLR